MYGYLYVIYGNILQCKNSEREGDGVIVLRRVLKESEF